MIFFSMKKIVIIHKSVFFLIRQVPIKKVGLKTLFFSTQHTGNRKGFNEVSPCVTSCHLFTSDVIKWSTSCAGHVNLSLFKMHDFWLSPRQADNQLTRKSLLHMQTLGYRRKWRPKYVITSFICLCWCFTSRSIIFSHVKLFFSVSGPQIRVCNRKLSFLFLNQNICCGYTKKTSRWDSSFEHPKHMFKLIDKKIIAFLL